MTENKHPADIITNMNNLTDGKNAMNKGGLLNGLQSYTQFFPNDL